MRTIETGTPVTMPNDPDTDRGMAAQMPCAIVALDDQLRITGLNDEAATLLGLKATTSSGKSYEIFPTGLKLFIQEMFNQETAQARHPAEVRMLAIPSANKRMRQVRVTSSPQRGSEGKFRGLLLVLQEVFVSDSAEENLRRQDRLAGLGTLSATMAHEIKNALVAGKTFLDLLLEKHEDNELTEIVRKEMDRIDSIVTQILRYSAHSRQSFVETSVHEVLEDSLRLVTPKLDGQTIRLEKSFTASPDLIHGSSYQLQQAFVNLFLNAVDAMPSNGQLKITTALIEKTPPTADENNGRVQVTVADTGTGITPENLARLFQPFFTTKRTGTGLGLATTQRIFHEHGGTISVQSRIGRGTQFTIDLPALGKP